MRLQQFGERNRSRSDLLPGPALYALEIVSFAAAYYLAGRISAAYTPSDRIFPDHWPAAGFALSMACIGGWRFLLAFVAGGIALYYDQLSGQGWNVILAETIGAFAGLLVLRRTFAFVPRLDRSRDVLAISGLAALPCSIVTTAVMGFLTPWKPEIGTMERQSHLLNWWMTDLNSCLTIMPFLLLWMSHGRKIIPRKKVFEAAAIGFVLVVLCWVLFGSPTEESHLPFANAFIVLPVVIFIALRYGPLGTSTAVFAITIASRYAIYHYGQSEQSGHSRTDIAWMLESFTSVLSLTGSLLSAIVSEKSRQAQTIQAIIKSTNDGFVLFQENGKILDINEAFCRMTGYSREELLAKTLDELEIEEPATPSTRSAPRQESNSSVETQFLAKNGSVVMVEITINQLEDEEDQFFAFVRDTTERKSLEEERLVSRKMEAVGQLAGGVAHDFNNILTIIIGNLSFAAESANGELHQFITQALRASQRGAELVKQMLGFSRKLPASKKPINVAALVEEVAKFVRRTFDRRIEIVVERHEKMGNVLADPTQVQNVLLNLSINARDAIEDAKDPSVSRMMRIVLKTENVEIIEPDLTRSRERPTGHYLKVSITDTGIGMDKTVRARLFEPFFTTKEVGRGTGLGLASAYGIIRQHGGWIDVESEPNLGSTFSVVLPVTDRPAVPPSEYIKPADPRHGTETILYADDEPMVRDLLRRMLEEHGYTTIEAKDGQEAVDLFKEHMDRIDLVMLDLSMPKLSGEEALVRLRRIKPDVRVVISSGYSLESGSLDLSHFTDVTVITKPFRRADLLRTIREIFDAEKEKGKNKAESN